MGFALVTGGAGFIGSYLVDRLIAMKIGVIVVDDFTTHRRPPKARGDVRIWYPYSAQQSVWGLPVDRREIDVVFHLGGKVGPSGVLKFAGNIAKDTIDAATAAAWWADGKGCPLIDISTSEVYGSPDEANSEDTYRVFKPGFSARQEYAVSKLAAEQALLNRRDLDVRIIRPFNVTGARQRPDGGFVLPRFAIQALTGQPLTVFQPGYQKRAFTHVEDIVDGIIAVWQKGESHEVYNLGNPDNICSIVELAQEVAETVGWSLYRERPYFDIVDPKTVHGPLFEEAPEKVPNADKAMSLLGWSPTRDRHSIVQEVVGYWRGFLEAGGEADL